MNLLVFNGYLSGNLISGGSPVTVKGSHGLERSGRLTLFSDRCSDFLSQMCLPDYQAFSWSTISGPGPHLVLIDVCLCSWSRLKCQLSSFFFFFLLACRFWWYMWEGMGLGLCVSRCVQKSMWEKSECKSCESERIVLVFEWVMMSLFTGHHSSPLEPTHTHTLAYTHFFIVFAIMACVLNSSQFEKHHMVGFITKSFIWGQARDDAVMRYGSCFQTASGYRSGCLYCFQCRHDGNCAAEVVDGR